MILTKQELEKDGIYNHTQGKARPSRIFSNRNQGLASDKKAS
jgi:hypothetical protein